MIAGLHFDKLAGRKSRKIPILLGLLLLLLLFPPLQTWAASEETDWQLPRGSATISFLDAEGEALPGLEELPLDAAGLSFSASRVSYGELRREPYHSVSLHFSLVDYNFYLKDENGDVDLSLLPSPDDVVVRLKLGNSLLEADPEQLSCRSQQGYLCLDVDFLDVNPFDDKSRDAQLQLQYWDQEGLLHKGQLAYSFQALELPESPADESKDQIQMDVVLQLPEAEEEAPRSQTPYVLVDSCALEGRALAGENFRLNLTIRNSHKKLEVENLLLQLGLPEGWLLEEASNQRYLGTLGPGESQSLSLSIKAPYRAEAEVYPIELHFSYEYVDRGTRRQESLSHELRLPLEQRLLFQADPVQSLSSYELGQEAQIVGTFGNWGGEPLYNVTVALEGPWPCAENFYQLGTLKAGEAGRVSFDVELSQEGESRGLLRYGFETREGQRLEEERLFSLVVLPAKEAEEDDENADSNNSVEIRYVPQVQAAETSSATRTWLVAAGVLFVLGAAALLARSRWD